MTETMDDILEGLANQLGIYGAHPEEGREGIACNCRCCWSLGMKARIEAAVMSEKKLALFEKWDSVMRGLADA